MKCLCFALDLKRTIDTLYLDENDDYMTCIGLGYKIELGGIFRPDDDWEDEIFPGIKEYRFYLLGKEIAHDARD